MRRILIMSAWIFANANIPARPAAAPLYISANTSGIPQNTTYVGTSRASRSRPPGGVRRGEDCISLVETHRLVAEADCKYIARANDRPAPPRPTAPHCIAISRIFGPSTTRGARGRKITHTSCNSPYMHDLSPRNSLMHPVPPIRPRSPRPYLSAAHGAYSPLRSTIDRSLACACEHETTIHQICNSCTPNIVQHPAYRAASSTRCSSKAALLSGVGRPRGQVEGRVGHRLAGVGQHRRRGRGDNAWVRR